VVLHPTPAARRTIDDEMQQRLQTGNEHMTSGNDLHLHVWPVVPHPSPFGHDTKAVMEPTLRSSSSKRHTPPAARSSHASVRMPAAPTCSVVETHQAAAALIHPRQQGRPHSDPIQT
ncbi:hypothetical protein ACLOJK_026882, partial [Asimina triloba]